MQQALKVSAEEPETGWSAAGALNLQIT